MALRQVRLALLHVSLWCVLFGGAAIAVEAQAAQATLAWDYTASGAAGFALYCGTASGQYSQRVDVGNTTSYTITGLSAGVTYYCATTAYDASKLESSFSGEVTVVVPAAPPPSAAPQLISQTPAPNVTGVRTGTMITATFSKPVDPSTISFALSGPSSTVPATVSYDPLTLTAELHPTAALAASTQYTATITGAKDLAGNLMTGSVTWTFSTVVGQVNCPCTIWSSTAAPAVTAASDTQSVELGVKFRADIDGSVTGIRFYKSSLNVGPHVATLWTSSGTRLATATFSSETSSGWQQVNFSSPVPISAGTTYVASYHASGGRYAANSGYFSTKSYDSGVLHALKAGIDGDNGVYSYGTAVSFPTNTYQSTNYWVDVVYTPGQLNCPCTIWPSTAIPVVASYPDAGAGEAGVRFRSDVNGLITGVRFYKSAANTGPHVASLWTAGGALLARATFTSETASGWQEVAFSSPVPIVAGTTYVASYHTNVGHYAADHEYFANGGVDRGPLHALRDGVDGGNGAGVYSATSIFPGGTYRSTNYWVDVVFKTP